MNDQINVRPSALVCFPSLEIIDLPVSTNQSRAELVPHFAPGFESLPLSRPSFLVECEDNVEPSVPAFDPLFTPDEIPRPGSFPAFSLMPP